MSSARGREESRKASDTRSNEVSELLASAKGDIDLPSLSLVAQELENELVVVNDDFALQDGRANEVDPEELDDSRDGVNRRLREQARRTSIRGSLERMTLFFKLPAPGYLWSRPEVLFFGESTDCISTVAYHLP